MAQELSRFDSLLLDGAASGKSADELSRLAGGTLTPAQCLQHVRSMLADRDIWTTVERKQLVTHQLLELAARMKAQFHESGDPAQATLQLKTLTQISALLEKQSSITEDEMNRVNQKQARMIFDLVVAGFQRAKELLAAQYPDLEWPQLEQALLEGVSSVTYYE